MEYIIVDSNNNWLATDTKFKDALKSFEDMKSNLNDNDGQYGDIYIGDTIYLYKAKEIKRFENK